MKFKNFFKDNTNTLISCLGAFLCIFFTFFLNTNLAFGDDSADWLKEEIDKIETGNSNINIFLKLNDKLVRMILNENIKIHTNTYN